MVLMAGMELPLAAIRRQIASAVDIIVHLGRLRDKSRKVLEIVEITGYEDGEITYCPLYAYEEGKLRKRNEIKYTEKLERSGFI